MARFDDYRARYETNHMRCEDGILELNRGQYFLLIGERINAQQAKEVGLVAEILRLTHFVVARWTWRAS